VPEAFTVCKRVHLKPFLLNKVTDYLIHQWGGGERARSSSTEFLSDIWPIPLRSNCAPARISPFGSLASRSRPDPCQNPVAQFPRHARDPEPPGRSLREKFGTELSCRIHRRRSRAFESHHCVTRLRINQSRTDSTMTINESIDFFLALIECGDLFGTERILIV
jgi:hypothetical protein